ncbi:hypothetical protein [Streptomyces sp. NPDC056682]|uniref:hypothetical protein n=1 Tax=Streptomyces sp. NPDC056682 TaxID=3345909 RepID=UPI0036BB7111
MPLLERFPDNSAIDAQLRYFTVDPNRIEELLRIDPNRIDPRQWTVLQVGNGWGHGVIGRSRTMSYDFGSPTGLGPAVYNTTANPIIRTIGGEETIGTETSFSVSTTIESRLFDIMNVSVTTSYGHWSTVLSPIRMRKRPPQPSAPVGAIRS